MQKARRTHLALVIPFWSLWSRIFCQIQTWFLRTSMDWWFLFSVNINYTGENTTETFLNKTSLYLKWNTLIYLLQKQTWLHSYLRLGLPQRFLALWLWHSASMFSCRTWMECQMNAKPLNCLDSHVQRISKVMDMCVRFSRRMMASSSFPHSRS